MMKNKFKKLLLTTLTIISGVFVASAATIFVSATAKDGWSVVTIGSYVVGDEFVVPERTYFLGGEQYDITHKVTFPSGKSVSSAVIGLDDAGVYKVSYIARKGNSVKTTSVEFKADLPLTVKSGEGTEAGYLAKGGYKHATEAEGLYMRIQQSDTVEIQQPISIDTSANEDIMLCKFFIAPDAIGAADFRTLKLVFTDVTDENNYLVVSAACVSTNSTAGWAVGHTYFLAGGNGQLLKGYEKENGKLHVDDGYGCPVRNISYYGYDIYKNPLDMVNNQAEVTYNPATQEIKVGSFSVIDLDSKDFFGGETDVLWNGFKSGIVKLSVYAENYNETTANVIFTHIKGVDLASGVVVDSEPPVITVLSDYGDDMPEARVGDYYYEIPKATAFDVFSGEVKTDVAVYLNYNSASKTSVAIVNGKFKTSAAGQYAIVYTASDVYGNKATKILWVHAGAEISPITITVPSDTECECELGKNVRIAFPVISGGSGEKTFKAFVSHGGETPVKVDFENGEASFVPEKSGAWTVEYVATDYTGETGEFSYEINAVVPEKPYFEKEAVLPHVFVNGFEYVLPKVQVRDYTGGSLKIGTASVKVEDANGEKTYVSGSSFTPNVNENGDKIAIAYSYSYGNSVINSAKKEIPVIKGVENGVLNIENYFYSSVNAYGLEKSNLGLTFTVKNAADTSWTFANALAYSDFSMYINTFAGSDKFGSMVITLTDYYDREKTQTIEFYRSGSVFGVKCGSLNELTKISAVSDDKIDFTVKRGKLIVNNVSYDIENTINSDKIILGFKLVDAETNAKYRVYSVCNHKVTDISTDRISPVVTISSDYGGTHTVGEKYYICPAFAFDVVSPSVEFTLTVKDGKGNIVKDVNGVSLDGQDPSIGYTITLRDYTKYTITYVARDLSRYNRTTFEYEINVEDDIAPGITFKDSLPSEVKKGSKIVLPKYTVSDDNTAAEDISVEITLVNPYGKLKIVKTDNIAFENAGVYELNYLVYDAAGNTTLKTFRINVTD